ncbi:MAG: CTP synthase [Mollicutes bacterium]|nr:CTP synthase [Mollicutes bacterium]
MTKYVFVTGGVVSGLGKGITASSIALLLKSRGYKVFMQKFDPYFNVDPGTMNPIQHGEVFVTYDGCETDLDLGHYERFIDEELNYSSNITSGKIFKSVIEKERHGDYLGATVQMIPHVTNEIKNKVYEAGHSSGADIVITEVGGTVGDIESEVFIETLRQIQYEIGSSNSFFVHCTLVPFIMGSNELKTKPTQNSVKDLRNRGVRTDALVCRAPFETPNSIKEKLSLFCSIAKENVIDSIDVNNIYEIPINYYNQKLDEIILKQFDLPIKRANLTELKKLITTVNNLKKEIEIALVGKYVELHDAYISVVEALDHAGYNYNVKIKINWINSELLEAKKTNIKSVFKNSKGIVVPGGFGNRGIEGKIKAINYARENNIPFLGIGLGMQLAIVEFARNVCSLENANSTEFDSNTKEPVIDLMADQKSIVNIGTMRLGNYECTIKKDTLVYKIYKAKKILERHRNRYEFNNNYKEILEENGMVFSSINEKTNLVETIELPKLKYFIACQFHPEFKSRPLSPAPLFDSFVKTCALDKK